MVGYGGDYLWWDTVVIVVGYGGGIRWWNTVVEYGGGIRWWDTVVGYVVGYEIKNVSCDISNLSNDCDKKNWNRHRKSSTDFDFF